MRCSFWQSKLIGIGFRAIGKSNPLFSLFVPLLPPISPSQSSSNMVLIYHTGVKSYDVSLDTQTATVVTDSTLSYDKVLATIAKTGKKVNTGEADGEVKSVEVVAA